MFDAIQSGMNPQGCSDQWKFGRVDSRHTHTKALSGARLIAWYIPGDRLHAFQHHAVPTHATRPPSVRPRIDEVNTP